MSCDLRSCRAREAFLSGVQGLVITAIETLHVFLVGKLM